MDDPRVCAEALLSPTGAAGVAIKDPASLREGAGLLVCLKPVLEGGHCGRDWLTLLVG